MSERENRVQMNAIEILNKTYKRGTFTRKFTHTQHQQWEGNLQGWQGEKIYAINSIVDGFEIPVKVERNATPSAIERRQS